MQLLEKMHMFFLVSYVQLPGGVSLPKFENPPGDLFKWEN